MVFLQRVFYQGTDRQVRLQACFECMCGHHLKRVFLSLVEPFFEARLFRCLNCPDLFTPGSTPANAVIASQCVKRDTSQISAIN